MVTQLHRGTLVGIVAVVALLGGRHSLAQTTGTGTITGTVTDATGAVVPGAKVTATQRATGIYRSAETDSKGYYALSSLQIGEYDIKVSHAGFSTLERNGIVLNADTTVGVDVTMTLGSSTQTVTVTGEQPPLQTESGAVNTLVSGVQVRELALNGRNYTQFLTLGPGVNSPSMGTRMGVGQEGNPLISINGGGTNAVQYTYDGIIAMDTGGNRGIDLFPPMEAIEEVQIHKSNYTADTGSFGYGQVNVVTRSGGRVYHGSFYEIVGNSVFDARNFFAPSVSPFNQNMFGATIGGPVFPSSQGTRHEKLFFFYSQGWNRRVGPTLVNPSAPPVTQSVFTATTPTAAQRGGDFSSLLPAVITNPATGVAFPGNVIPPGMIDANATLILSKFYPLPNRAGSPNYTYSSNSFTGWREELGRVDYHVTPNAGLMVRYAYDTWYQKQSILLGATFPTTPGFITKPGQNLVIALTNTLSARTVNEFTFGFSRLHYRTFPTADRSGLSIPTVLGENTTNTYPNISISGYSNISVSGISNNDNNVYNWREDLSHQAGRHTLKTGVDILRLQKFVRYPYTNQQGSFTFNGTASGNALADFLLGDAFQYTEQSLTPNEYLFATDYEMYFQDDWKVLPNLTLNLGLREIMYIDSPEGTEKYNNIAGFYPSLYDSAKAPVVLSNGRLQPGTGDPLNGIITPTNLKGIGVDSALMKPRYGNLGPRFGFAYSPFESKRTVIRGGYGIFYHWDNPSQESLSKNPPFGRSITVFNTTLSSPGGGTGALFPVNLTTTDGLNYYYPQVQHWSLTVGQELLPFKSVMSVGYVGNHAVHLDQVSNINQPQPNLAVANGSVNQSTVVPYLGYGTINYDRRNGLASYHSLQVDVQRHFARGLMFEVAYTWSRARCKSVGQNTLLDQNEPGLCPQDQPQIFAVNYVYQFPFFRDRTGLERQFLAGWQLSGSTTQAAGYPFTITESGNRSGTGNAGRPDLIGPLNIQPGSVSNYFNTAAFALQPLGRFGTAGRGILEGPGRAFTNVSLSKNTDFRMFKDKKGTLKFTATFYNVLNQVSFIGVGTTYGSATFGQLTQALDPRRGEFALSLTY
jgi:hypothetical protein